MTVRLGITPTGAHELDARRSPLRHGHVPARTAPPATRGGVGTDEVGATAMPADAEFRRW